MRKPSPKERLLAKLTPQDGPQGVCLIWTGALNQCGYGVIKINGKTYLAHRFSFETFKGPIPPGLVVCHSCDTPRCCNPEHLTTGTKAENSADMSTKGRASRGTKRATEQEKTKAREMYRDGVTGLAISRAFGVHYETVKQWVKTPAGAGTMRVQT